MLQDVLAKKLRGLLVGVSWFAISKQRQISERRGCAVLRLNRSVHRYRAKRMRHGAMYEASFTADMHLRSVFHKLWLRDH